MSNRLTIDSLVLITLCSNIVKRDEILTTNQYLILERKIRNSPLKRPKCLLNSSLADIISSLNCNQKDALRINKLLSNIIEVIKQLIYYEKQGIYVTTIYEDDYPSLLKERMKKKAPLILFYHGNFKLLSNQLLSLFGPLKLSTSLEINIKYLIKCINDQGYTLVSSDLKGTNEIAVEEQLKLGGNIVLFTSSDFNKYKRKYREYIEQGRFIIFSHRDIYSSYDSVEAIETNNYLYAMSNIQLITYTQYNAGVIWFNAIQNIKMKWIKLLTLIDDDFYGNLKLVELGAIPFTMQQLSNGFTFNEIIDNNEEEVYDTQEFEQLSIFDLIN